MIDVYLDERCIYQYSKANNSIVIWRHRDGPLTGPVDGPLGQIKFANEWQVEHFSDMIDLLKDAWAKKMVE